MRVTRKQLVAAIRRLNEITGQPQFPWLVGENLGMVAQVGNYHLEEAYGGYSVCQMTNQSGGTRTIIPFCPARECLQCLQVAIDCISREAA